MVFIQVQKITASSEGIKTQSEFIRADKIENFRRFMKNPQHPMGKIDGEITKIMMKSLSEGKGGSNVYEIHINESEELFSKRLSKNGISIIVHE